MPKQDLLDELEDQFRHHAPTREQIARLAYLREAALKFAKAVHANVQPGADRSAAIRKIREAVMTANAGIVLERKSIPDENGQDASGRSGGY
jgi:hypothetical protein